MHAYYACEWMIVEEKGYNREKEKVGLYKRQLKPFLINEKRVENLTFFPSLLEKLLVEQWYADIKHSKEVNEISRNHWDQCSAEGDNKEELQEIFYKIHYEMHMDKFHHAKGKVLLPRIKAIAMYVAAACLIPLIFFGMWFWQESKDALRSQDVYSEIFAPYGSRLKFELPDGSSGWLNSGSTLKYPVRFTGSERNVTLNGEGYFNVKHNPKNHFVVSTQHYQVRALGTMFNVRAYGDSEKFQEITLEKGIVNIEKLKNDGSIRTVMKMKPGQHAQINLEENTIKVSNNDDGKFTSWKEGKLIFRNDPLSRLIKVMEKYYNVDFEVEDEDLFNYNFHATFEEETLLETLRLLKLSSPIEYKVLRRKMDTDGSYSKRKVILSLRK